MASSRPALLTRRPPLARLAASVRELPLPACRPRRAARRSPPICCCIVWRCDTRATQRSPLLKQAVSAFRSADVCGEGSLAAWTLSVVPTLRRLWATGAGPCCHPDGSSSPVRRARSPCAAQRLQHPLGGCHLFAGIVSVCGSPVAQVIPVNRGDRQQQIRRPCRARGLPPCGPVSRPELIEPHERRAAPL